LVHLLRSGLAFGIGVRFAGVVASFAAFCAPLPVAVVQHEAKGREIRGSRMTDLDEEDGEEWAHPGTPVIGEGKVAYKSPADEPREGPGQVRARSSLRDA